jgi:hypothetical protein
LTGYPCESPCENAANHAASDFDTPLLESCIDGYACESPGGNAPAEMPPRTTPPFCSEEEEPIAEVSTQNAYPMTAIMCSAKGKLTAGIISRAEFDQICQSDQIWRTANMPASGEVKEGKSGEVTDKKMPSVPLPPLFDFTGFGLRKFLYGGQPIPENQCVCAVNEFSPEEQAVCKLLKQVSERTINASIMRERETALGALNADLEHVEQIALHLFQLVEDQQDDIDAIVQNVEDTEIAAKAGLEDLLCANDAQKRTRMNLPYVPAYESRVHRKKQARKVRTRLVVLDEPTTLRSEACPEYGFESERSQASILGALSIPTSQIERASLECSTQALLDMVKQASLESHLCTSSQSCLENSSNAVINMVAFSSNQGMAPFSSPKSHAESYMDAPFQKQLEWVWSYM